MEINRLPKLSGSFLCVDYCNEWTDERYDRECKILKEAGMEYIIAMSAVLLPVNRPANVSYPTQIPEYKDSYLGTDCLDKLLRAAEANGIRVFLGMNLDDIWWECWWDLDKLLERREWLYGQMELGNRMADEFYEMYHHKYPSAFYGFYWMWECWNFNIMSLTARGRNQAIGILADCLNISLRHIHKHYPGMPTLLSPFVNTALTTPDDQYHQWKDVFARTEFAEGDIFCAQDSCGAGGQKVKDLEEWYSAYARAVATKKGLRIWANNENFETPDACSTTVDNYVKQLEITDPFVERHVAFSYIHYYSPCATIGGYHKAYLNYLKNGYVGDEMPENPKNVKAVKSADGKSVHITWEHDEAHLVAGFRIYRNGQYIGRRNQSRLGGDGKPTPIYELNFTDENPTPDDQGNLVYSVAAYSVEGAFSRRIPAAE